ncbi:ArsR/SmtB family transcription factor [Streptomyces sp. NPDC012389]|uniref:ArsR/SmtB family transcription factor n=1 Tax=unclassified Streptomyces TaxID=2593676 RepID=UPI00081D9BA8|nr:MULTISPECIES: metalloregulator ArsR/SmtB family transcription factor [unclassified Streptomyces]MYR94230.1 helix-turn-helix domain-containing protein [Streptomyces sp. SID4937]MYX13997.1 helix-turn-helix domain-containing protein [Streptomyces sp. SID8374]SCD67290.1 transcriptional regulator, ArsR family [Streptomyces sp. ScaeMP-e83]
MTENETGRRTPVGKHNMHNVDARTLRTLAHPLRIRLLNALREFGPATASGLGERLGESSGATSYHLRQLADAELVEDAPELGKGRERWWRAVHEGSTFESADFLSHADPEVRGAIDVVMHEVATTHAQELNTWLGTMGEWPEEWRRSSDMSDFKLRLTPELARELSEKLHEVVESFRDRVPEGTEGSAVVRTHLHTFPRPSE